MSDTIIPVIMSGGAGTRLWPLSRKSQPKQFLAQGSEHSLFQDTINRCTGAMFDARPIVVGSANHRFLIAEDLRKIGAEADILLEPVPRNSCAAIAAGCFRAIERDKNAIVIVVAADHIIPDKNAFQDMIAKSRNLADEGKLVAFGVRPDSPATGYGYILPGDTNGNSGGYDIRAFVEKPDRETANTYVEEGYLWNSGNFMFGAKAFLDELRTLNPAIYEAVKKASDALRPDLDFLRLEEDAFARAPNISVDYAVMEKTGKAAVFPVDYDWSDIGTWKSVWNNSKKDDDGNAKLGEVFVSDARNNLVQSTDALLVVSGVDDLAIVATRDAILVTPKDRSQLVGSLVKELRDSGRVQATEFPKVFRPWGNYEQIDTGDHYQVKRITVDPGGVLSLQKHKHRSEHWVVVNGIAEVTLHDMVFRLEENQSIEIPLGAVHRLANREETPLVLIEVQSGSYLGEDDIYRYDDIYNREAEETDESKA